MSGAGYSLGYMYSSYTGTVGRIMPLWCWGNLIKTHRQTFTTNLPSLSAATLANPGNSKN